MAIKFNSKDSRYLAIEEEITGPRRFFIFTNGTFKYYVCVFIDDQLNTRQRFKIFDRKHFIKGKLHKWTHINSNSEPKTENG